MKVVVESETVLKLRDRPWIMLLGLALLCMLFGYAVWAGEIPNKTFPWPFVALPPLVFLLFLYYSEFLEVAFDRNTGRVRITRKRLLGTKETEYELGSLSKVGVIGTPDSDGGTHRIALYFEGLTNPVPLTFYETNASSMGIAADRIEAWLERDTR